MAMTGTDGITVVVAREVAPGREDEFHHWVDDLLAAAQRCPGFLGSGLLEPAPGGAVWHVVYRFDSPEHLAAWEGSAERARLLEHGAEFVHTVAVRRLDGMDAWFAAPAGPPARPPRWKTFLMTATVILVLQFVLSSLLRPLVGDWPLLLRTAAVIIPLVALMTWVVMPRLSHWLAGWLYRSRPS
ncbi:antibiotic biosynthesis monooxygenase [Blastococcus montanus]|uniref:antibiotic biosynthesis monooxygenase n=1 Tax=Blastococcus montanus TaxID=3144973 RepID=UPI00320AA739